MTVGTVAEDAGQLFQEHLCSAGESLVHVLCRNSPALSRQSSGPRGRLLAKPRGHMVFRLWCNAPSRNYFCATEIAESKKGIFLFPLVEMFLSPKGTKPLEEF